MDQLTFTIITSFFAGLALTIFALYCIWCFIRSAVESGTVRAIERMLKEYTDLIEDVPPDNQPPLNNDFEKDLNGWISFKK